MKMSGVLQEPYAEEWNSVIDGCAGGIDKHGRPGKCFSSLQTLLAVKLQSITDNELCLQYLDYLQGSGK